MKDNYDFSDSIQNPYTKHLQEQITLQVDQNTIQYFKKMAEEKGVPYQNLINLYLRDCVEAKRELQLSWS